jgi:predicted ATPase/class 3 adenylate cyclase
MGAGQAPTFGALLRQHRAAAGLTQEELAERAGLSVRGLGYLEKDARQPYRDTVRRLAEALRLDPDARLALEQAAREAPVAAGPVAFGALVRHYRQAAALSQEELAERTGLSAVSISGLERGAHVPRRDTVQLLAEALGLSADERATLEATTRRLGLVPTRPTSGATPSNLPLPPTPLLGREREVASGFPARLVTFLFTDIEGSTMRWDQHPQAMRAALARHDAVLQEGIIAHGGVVLTEQGEGDSFFALFAGASDALAAACALQQALVAEPWPEEVAPIRVRMALHTGEAGMQGGVDFRGTPVNRCARLRTAAHGGQVLLSAATYEVARDDLPPGMNLRDLGEHRLKDLTRPERIYQIVHPDLPSAFPPLKTLDAQRHNLPVQLTPLVGREREVTTVRDRLLDPDTRLLTLTGTGGTGKTRLALQVAAEALDAFPDGTFFVNLAPIGDPDLVLPTIAQTLGLTESGSQPLRETLHTFLQDKHLLLLLDNFEQVLDAAAVVADLLAARARVRIMVTSRAVLHLRGERLYPVPPLALPSLTPLPPLERLTQYAAVRLFIERTRNVQPDFVVTNETAPAVAEICVRLDGLPLAIELAAARVRLFTPLALLARLSSRLGVLTGGARDLPARQRTLRATIDWSYSLLTAEDQILFARLSVFVGGHTLEAIEAICNPDGALDVLGGVESLLEKSLLEHTEVEGETRFVLLETLHEYARERLEASGEAEELRRRHTAYFLELAQRAAVHGGTVEAGWLERLEREHDNLRAALGWTHDRAEVELEVKLAVALALFWATRGYLGEARERLGGLLALQGRHRHALPPDLRAEALFWLGHMLWAEADYERAAPLMEETLALCRVLGEPRVAARCLRILGHIARERGDGEQATALFREALDLARDIGDTARTAWALLGLGDVAREQGDAARLERFCAESLTLFREVSDKRGEGYALNNLGLAARLRQDVPQAAALFADSLAVFRELGFAVGVAEVLSNVGGLARVQGQLEQARTAFVESLALARTAGPMAVVADDLVGLAGVAGAQQQAARASRLFGTAQALREANRMPRWPVHETDHERDVAATRAALGEDAFTAAWAAGQVLPLEQAIAEALGEEAHA